MDSQNKNILSSFWHTALSTIVVAERGGGRGVPDQAHSYAAAERLPRHPALPSQYFRQEGQFSFRDNFLARRACFPWHFAQCGIFWLCLFCGWVFSRFVSVSAPVFAASGVCFVGHFPTLGLTNNSDKIEDALHKSCFAVCCRFVVEPTGQLRSTPLVRLLVSTLTINQYVVIGLRFLFYCREFLSILRSFWFFQNAFMFLFIFLDARDRLVLLNGTFNHVSAAPAVPADVTEITTQILCTLLRYCSDQCVCYSRCGSILLSSSQGCR